mgnify:CR=1 FL=1|tara:strand:- start:566 stop:889 length:324 start_codon:yes stop_codon:yes gene_type:complete
MGNSFKLSVHLEHIIRDIVDKRQSLNGDDRLSQNIFTFLDTIYENRGKVTNLEAVKLIKSGFKDQLIKEAMCEMSDDEDYLTSTINKKIDILSREYIKEWINKKIVK